MDMKKSLSDSIINEVISENPKASPGDVIEYLTNIGFDDVYAENLWLPGSMLGTNTIRGGKHPSF